MYLVLFLLHFIIKIFCLNYCGVLDLPVECEKRRMGKKITVRKGDKRSEEYTFIDDAAMNLSRFKSQESTGTNTADRKTKEYFRLKNNPADLKSRKKSRLAGGHSMQGHSPVYE
ncbi:MAG: hypothetical protein DA330_04990 [Nitrososphaera sp.]|nr:hypothetical protein [Nitrososphaera sp.]